LEIYENQREIFDFRLHSLFLFLFRFLEKEGKEENKPKKEEEREKGRKKKEAGYSAVKMRNNQPSQRFYGVNCSVAQLCRLARRKCLQKVEPETV
jgi:hypothetical protein